MIEVLKETIYVVMGASEWIEKLVTIFILIKHKLYFKDLKPCETSFAEMVKLGIETESMISYEQLTFKSQSAVERCHRKYSVKRFEVRICLS